MSEARDMIHPEAKFLSSYEPVKLDKLLASKIQWWDRHRIDIPISEGKNQKEEKGVRSQASPKPSKANSIRY